MHYHTSSMVKLGPTFSLVSKFRRNCASLLKFTHVTSRHVRSTEKYGYSSHIRIPLSSHWLEHEYCTHFVHDVEWLLTSMIDCQLAQCYCTRRQFQWLIKSLLYRARLFARCRLSAHTLPNSHQSGSSGRSAGRQVTSYRLLVFVGCSGSRTNHITSYPILMCRVSQNKATVNHPLNPLYFLYSSTAPT